MIESIKTYISYDSMAYQVMWCYIWKVLSCISISVISILISKSPESPILLLCTAITPSALPCSCHRSSQLTPFRSALPVVLYSCHVIVEVEPCSFRPEILFCAVLLHHLVSSWSACQSLASVTDGFPDAWCWIIFNPVTDSFSDICHTSSNSAVPRLIISGPCHRKTS